MFNLSIYMIRQWQIVGQKELTINVPIYAAHNQVPIVHISQPSQMYENKQVNELFGCHMMDMKQILSHKHRHQYSYHLSTELSPSLVNNGSVILPYIIFNSLSRAKDCTCP